MQLPAQEIAVQKHVEHIQILKDTSFIRQIRVSLKENESPLLYPIFFDAELEKVSDIKVYLKKGKRYKEVDKPIVKEQVVDLDYIASKKIKSVFIPPDSEAKITYTVECPELMYFSDLRFFSNNVIDTLSYQVDVPNAFHFEHNFLHKDSLDYIVMDSTAIDDFSRWTINAVPKKTEPDILTYFGIYRNKKNPLMRTIVVPKSYEEEPLKYMNDWYLGEVKAVKGLNSSAVEKIDELTKGIWDKNEIMEILYDYVHNNFKYVAIEIGMGAFIPSHVNEVFLRKEGDCKDLSNFLSEALNYKGIKSDIALAATYNHISDCDFPSLSSANHLVCVAYIDGTPIILDPTDPIHYPNSPVESLQDRTIFVVDPNGGELMHVDKFDNQENLITVDVNLTVDSGQMILQGNFRTEYKGISGNFLRRAFEYLNDDKVKTSGSKHFENVFGNQSVKDFNIEHKSNTILANGKLAVQSRFFDAGDHHILLMDFLPSLLEAENSNSLLDGVHLGTNFYKIVHVNIDLDKPVVAFDPITYQSNENGVRLNLEISSSNNRTVQCSYEFELDHHSVDKNNLDAINKAVTAFNKTINEPILLRKKG